MTAHNQDSCLNCQAILDGHYCGRCGQAKSAQLIPIKEWLSDISGVCLEFDFKLLRTLKRILLQPGQATLDFAAGQRVPYSGPARVYILVSAISIAAMTMRGDFDMNNGAGLNFDGDIQKRIQFLFPFVNLLSPLVVACILASLQRTQYFQLHLAFSLHYWSFMIAVATPLIFIPPDSIWGIIAFSVLALTVTGYLVMAHRRVYAMSMFRRLVICGLLLLSVPFFSFLFTLALFVIVSLV